jgi:hypothetical protein
LQLSERPEIPKPSYYDTSSIPPLHHRVPSHTRSAIRYATNALRKPREFTLDLVELNASMSDRPRTTAGTQATAQDASTSTAAQPTLRQMGSLPGGMRSPRDIVALRNEREAAKEAARRAEVENHEEQVKQEEAIRELAEQRARVTAGKQPARQSERSQSSGLEALQGARGSARDRDDTSPPQPGDIGVSAWTVPRAYSVHGSQHSQQQPYQKPIQTSAKQQMPSLIAPVASNTKQQPATGASFPHAFERWEQLSAHWEGLTSYWIHKLQQNTDKIQHDMTLKQLSDQVSDLSAAGANLFHAVVELQRLRASSERKFGRWFEQVRGDQELATGRIADLERLLQEEKDAQLNAPQVNIPYFNARIAEINYENSVIKAESKRAWDEMGMREKADRDMQMMLRSGRPIYIGGIQVVPTQASYNQSGTMVRDPHQQQQQQYPNYPMPNYPQSQGPVGSPAHQQAISQGYGIYDQQQPSPTDTDPFSGQAAPRSAHRPTTSGGFQAFNSGPSPPPIGSMTPVTGPPQQYPGMSPQVQRMQQHHTTSPQYPFPSPGGMAPGTMPFYHQSQQYIHQPGGSSSSRQYQQQSQPYVDSGSPSGQEDDDSPWLEPRMLDSPPQLESQHQAETYGQYEHEQQQEPGSPEHSYTPVQQEPPPRGGLYLQYSPEGTRPQLQQGHQQGYTQQPPVLPSTQTPHEQQQDKPYTDQEQYAEHPDHERPRSPEQAEEESVQYEGAGYGRHAADWEGVAAHQHYASRLSDVLEEEDSMKSPSSQRSSRVPTLSQQRRNSVE